MIPHNYLHSTALEQLKRAFAICKKDVRIYYLKGPVIIFGILIPVFLFAAFLIGRDLPPQILSVRLDGHDHLLYGYSGRAYDNALGE